MTTERNILLLGAAIAFAALVVWSTPASDARAGAATEMRHYKTTHPDCEACGAKDRVLRRNEVHHIVPCATDGSKATDTNNLITLCRPDHIAYGHCGDGACRKYCPNIREVLKVRIVLENK